MVVRMASATVKAGPLRSENLACHGREDDAYRADESKHSSHSRPVMIRRRAEEQHESRPKGTKFKVMNAHHARKTRADADPWLASGWTGAHPVETPYPSDSEYKAHVA
jgi:hypothetical protein